MDGDFTTASFSDKPRRTRALNVVPHTPTRPVPFDVPGFSIELLGRQLALTGHRSRLLDTLQEQIGREEKGSALTADRLLQRQVDRADNATAEHLAALRSLILHSRPATPADAVVQLIACHAFMWQEAGDAEQARRLVQRVLAGAARCVAAHYGLSLGDLGGATYASVSEDEWPDVDLSGVRTDPAWTRAVDGTVTEWER